MNDRQKLQRSRVAPYNPNPRWPAGYFQVLKELGIEEPHSGVRRRFWIDTNYSRKNTLGLSLQCHPF